VYWGCEVEFTTRNIYVWLIGEAANQFEGRLRLNLKTSMFLDPNAKRFVDFMFH